MICYCSVAVPENGKIDFTFVIVQWQHQKLGLGVGRVFHLVGVWYAALGILLPVRSHWGEEVPGEGQQDSRSAGAT